MANDWTAQKIKFHTAVFNQYQLSDPIRDTVFQKTELGETGSAPINISVDAVNQTDTTTLTANSSTELAEDIVFDVPLKAWDFIPKQQEEDLPQIDPRSLYAERIGKSIGRGRGERILALMGNDGSATQVTADFLTTSTLEANVVAALKTAVAALDDNGVDTEDDLEVRLKSSLFYSIFGPQNIMSRDVGGQGNISERGRRARVRFMGCNIEPTGLVFGKDLSAATRLATKYKGNFTNFMGAVYHKNALGVRQATAKPETMVDPSPENTSTLVQGRLRMGTKVLQAAGLILLVDDGI